MVSVLLKIVVIATLVEASLVLAQQACETPPFPLYSGPSTTLQQAVLGPFLPYTGNPADVIGIFCTTGCSTTFRKASINDPDLTYISLDAMYFVTHGYTDQVTPADQGWMNRTATDLACKTSATVCLIDWYPLAIYRYDVTVIQNLKIVADYITQFIKRLKELGAQLKNITLIGHSLGAHVVGLIGKNFGPRTIGRIFGLDPGGPLFVPVKQFITVSLAKDDAIQTICLHTNPGVWGTLFDLCDANFWPNQPFIPGIPVPNPSQPGCAVQDYSCSHGRCLYLFYVSLFKEFVGTRVCAVGDTNCNSADTETCGLDYSGKIGDFIPSTSDCYPFY